MSVVASRWRNAFRAWGLRSRAAVVGCLAALPLLVFGVVAYLDYLDEVHDARQTALRSAYSLAEHADAVFSAIEVALLQVDQALDARAVGEARGDGNFHQLLQNTLRRLPPVESVFLVDEVGTIAASSRAFPMPPYDVQHREYFQAAKAGHEGLFLSVPFRGEFARSVAFTASRPVVRDGVFRGLVAVTVFPEYFHSLYRSTFLAEEGGSTAVLLRRDGTVIFRSPDTRGAEPISASPDLLSQTGSQNTGLLVGRGVIDARSDITAFRTLPQVPLTFVYAVRESDMTADWYRRLAGYGFVMACMSGLLAGGGALVLFGPAAPLLPQAAGERAPGAGEEAGSGLSHGMNALLDAVRSSLGLARRTLAEPPPAGVDAREVIEGAAFGVSAAQRLLAGGWGERPDGRIVNAAASLRALRQLLMGSSWPPMELDVDRPLEALEAFADPAPFDLALFDLAMGLLEQAPEGARLAVRGEQRSVQPPGPGLVEPGDYVVLVFRVLSAAEDLPRRGAEACLRRVERFAAASNGVLVLEAHEDGSAGATLWLPAALAKSDPGRA
ncbi:cache domain-containing protein [Aquabacter cavernae]|uniref:cache domain-containing protein n=1 Tax=Aquabacter cavernae TaxID=2496029 RepID=UPI0013DEC0FE|nr:cache domain-containing protein [Aquabacter cavernae]